MTKLTMAQAKALQIKANEDIQSLSREECYALDKYIDNYALDKVRAKLPPEPWREFVLTMIKAHMGSIEVDEILTKLECYPSWSTEGKR